MSRNPIAAYTHRNGFALGQLEFKDFLWEALYDPAAQCAMGDTAENLAKQMASRREEVDRIRRRSFDRALVARPLHRGRDRRNGERDVRGGGPDVARHQAAA